MFLKGNLFIDDTLKKQTLATAASSQWGSIFSIFNTDSFFFLALTYLRAIVYMCILLYRWEKIASWLQYTWARGHTGWKWLCIFHFGQMKIFHKINNICPVCPSLLQPPASPAASPNLTHSTVVEVLKVRNCARQMIYIFRKLMISRML